MNRVLAAEGVLQTEEHLLLVCLSQASPQIAFPRRHQRQVSPRQKIGPGIVRSAD
jgi:hypothetical protein